MDDSPRHLTSHVLRAAREGQLDDSRFIRFLLDHLEEVCPECKTDLAAEREQQIPLSAYRGIGGRVARRARVQRAQAEAGAKEREVPVLVETLRGLSSGQRHLLIRNVPERFAHPLLVEALIREAKSCLPGYPKRSLGWADTAAEVVSLHPEPLWNERVRALAYQGNAYRADQQFGHARELLSQARRLADRHRIADVDIHAEIHSFLGSLWTDLRRFDEAADRLDEAADLYLSLGDEESLAEVSMNIGNLRSYRVDIDGALEADQAAIVLLDAAVTPSLFLAARFNYAYGLFEIGEPSAANAILAEDDDLYREHANPHFLLRRSWLQRRLMKSPR